VPNLPEQIRLCWLPWLAGIALFVAVAVTYLLAAQLSLVLLTKPDGVAVFWPAAGISSGALIALGAKARLPVTLGVAFASTAASLLGNRSIPATIVFTISNCGEALLVSWLIQNRFADGFRLESVRSVVGLFAAALIGAATSGMLATVGFILFYSPQAPVLTTWFSWSASDALGIILVAPLLIGFAALRHDPPDQWELAKGTLTLAALAVISAVGFGSSEQNWYTVLPVGLLLPVLLAAHCRPVFAAAAALILGYTIVWSATFGLGDLGQIPDLHDRAYAARATLLAMSACILMLSALFAERRHKEAALKDSNERLQLALAGAELGVWSIDTKSGRLDSDARDSRIHGYPADAVPKTLAEARSFIHPDDLSHLNAAFESSKRAAGSRKVEYRLAPDLSKNVVDQEHWVSVDVSAVRGAGGQAVRWLGISRDVTERKQAEQGAKRLVSLIESSDDAIISTDLSGVISSWNQGAERIFGYAAEEIIGRSIALIIPADRRHEELNDLERIRRGERVNHYETVRRRKDGTLVDTSLTVSPLHDAAGSVVGASNIARDISTRKRAEEHQRALNAELDHRVKNVLATVCAIIDQTRGASRTHSEFVMGLDHRIRSLASTHDLLSRSHWHGVSLAEIVRREFAPYASGDSSIGGPSITLKAEATAALAMVLHELTTNAAKYGAFSNGSGRVLLKWWWLQNSGPARLVIDWQEVGGPPVQSPSRLGYGTSVVRELIPFELGGSVDLVFGKDGLRCRMEIPADWIGTEGAASNVPQTMTMSKELRGH
jgi:PAS domain S-box-containing protein